MIKYKKFWDELCFEINNTGEVKVEIINEIKGQNIIIFEEDNLVYKAIKLLKEKTDFKEGITVEIKKRIPIGAGLGGASSNAGSTLLFLNEHLNLNISPTTLNEMALSLGSDVPFFLHDKSARVSGQGEKIELFSFADFFEIHVFTNPDCFSETPLIFSNLDLKSSIHPNISDIKKYLIEGDYANLVSSLFNSLELVFFNVFPQMHAEFIKLHKNKKYDLYFVTGSGSSFVGIKELDIKNNRN